VHVVIRGQPAVHEITTCTRYAHVSTRSAPPFP
jgi:hypothetical protein